MSATIWGKLAGAATGLAMGGPIGALIGGLAGHFVVDCDISDGSPSEKQLAFTMAVIALGAKMAKADGVVTTDEVTAFKEVFKVPDEDLKDVSRIFNLAKQDIAGYDSYAKQIAKLFSHDRKLLEDVLDGLFHIAKADNALHPKEVDYLSCVAELFGFSQTEFKYILSRHVRAEEQNPYHVLGVTPDIADQNLKRHYRKLVVENHPDQLIARGLPQEFVTIANDKLARINQAYDLLAKERGL